MADKKNDAHEAARKETAERTKEQLARTENVQPTPTQEENDRARLGVDSLKELDDKEPDGSPEQREVTAAPADAGYTTRAAAPAKK